MLLILLVAITIVSGPVVAQGASQADQRRAEPVQHRQRLLQAARRPDVGIDERGRYRQGRQVDLGRGALRHATAASTARPARCPTCRSVLKFDPSGKLVKSFGAGLLIFPHGIYVDRDGNVWVTDGQDNAPQPARGTGARGEAAAPAGAAGGGSARGGGPMGPRRARRTGTRFSSSAPTASCC